MQNLFIANLENICSLQNTKYITSTDTRETNCRPKLQSLKLTIYAWPKSQGNADKAICKLLQAVTADVNFSGETCLTLDKEKEKRSATSAFYRHCGCSLSGVTMKKPVRCSYFSDSFCGIQAITRPRRRSAHSKSNVNLFLEEMVRRGLCL